MFPFRDHNPSHSTPYVTYGIIAINVIVFLLNLDPAGQNEFYSRYALVPVWIAEGHDYTDFISSMFMHAGWMHIIGNMLFLWIFGDNIEDTLGHIPFLIFYIVCGIAAALSHVLLNLDSNVPLVGASGAIAGVMGAYWLLFPRAKVDVLIMLVVFVRTFSIPAFIVLTLWLGMQVFSGYSASAEGGGVAYWAHFGGFVAGALIMLPIWIKRGAKMFWTQNEYAPPYPPTEPLQYGRIPLIKR